uniref:Putative chloride channel protein k n=1 Tax=Amblyomma triste TaxID=251400 RepID=A0A023G6W4_AMBTT
MEEFSFFMLLLACCLALPTLTAVKTVDSKKCAHKPCDSPESEASCMKEIDCTVDPANSTNRGSEISSIDKVPLSKTNKIPVKGKRKESKPTSGSGKKYLLKKKVVWVKKPNVTKKYVLKKKVVWVKKPKVSKGNASQPKALEPSHPPIENESTSSKKAPLELMSPHSNQNERKKKPTLSNRNASQPKVLEPNHYPAENALPSLQDVPVEPQRPHSSQADIVPTTSQSYSSSYGAIRLPSMEESYAKSSSRQNPTSNRVTPHQQNSLLPVSTTIKPNSPTIGVKLPLPKQQVWQRPNLPPSSEADSSVAAPTPPLFTVHINVLSPSQSPPPSPTRPFVGQPPNVISWTPQSSNTVHSSLPQRPRHLPASPSPHISRVGVPPSIAQKNMQVTYAPQQSTLPVSALQPQRNGPVSPKFGFVGPNAPKPNNEKARSPKRKALKKAFNSIRGIKTNFQAEIKVSL